MSELSYYGTGRRKTSTARVFLRPGAGGVEINGRALDGYFPNDVLRMIVKQPLLLTETAEKFDVTVSVEGGGWAADLLAAAMAPDEPEQVGVQCANPAAINHRR